MEGFPRESFNEQSLLCPELPLQNLMDEHNEKVICVFHEPLGFNCIPELSIASKEAETLANKINF